MKNIIQKSEHNTPDIVNETTITADVNVAKYLVENVIYFKVRARSRRDTKKTNSVLKRVQFYWMLTEMGNCK